MAADFNEMTPKDSADFLRPTDEDTKQEIGTATPSVADAFFAAGNIAGPAEKVEFVQQQANLLQRTADGAVFLNPTAVQGGTTNGEKDDDEKDADDQLEAMLEGQRETWARTRSTFAGITMSGAEWGQLSNDLQDDGPLRTWLIAKLEKDGKSQQEAENLTNKIARLSGIQAKPEGQRTTEERGELKASQGDADVDKYLGMAAEEMKGHLQSKPAASMDGDSRRQFPTAPMLTAEFQGALAAAAPATSSADLKLTMPNSSPIPLLATGLTV